MSAQLGLVVFLLVDSSHLLCLLHRISSHHIILLHSASIIWGHASLVLLEATSGVLLTVLESSSAVIESLFWPLSMVIHTTSVVSAHGLTWCLHATSSSTASVGSTVLVTILPLDRFHGEGHLFWSQWIIRLSEFSISMSKMTFCAK